MKTQSTQELEALLSHVKEVYAGDYSSVSHALYEAIYYLHYLEEKTIDKDDLLDRCFSLHRLAECFYKAHIDKMSHQHQMIAQLADTLKEVCHELNDDQS